ncbi:estrogen-related receptor gamma [Lates japonicus]|uniref:Estrogen-related receptor gamma n=1 Tax=Lates japonicus TaxID=270547 RepID=A0AAD3NA32_LATJO|nr:estrogen-related receptor gamma [Lates japonicus]
MNLSKGPLVNSSSEDNSKSTFGKCGAGAWRMHQSYDPLEANHMRDAHALYNPSQITERAREKKKGRMGEREEGLEGWRWVRMEGGADEGRRWRKDERSQQEGE